jgi:pimeloyl-ACP methyl ester carboxylesterase
VTRRRSSGAGLVRRVERAAALGGLGTVVALGAISALAAERRRRRHTWLTETDPLGPKGCSLPPGRELVVPTDDGAHLAVTVAGPDDGPTVVLPHCWTGTRETWGAVARRLVLGGHRVVLYDQRGHGRSTAPDGHVPTIPQLGHDLRAVIAATDSTDVVLAGHSMGGMTIQSYALEHPEHFRAHVRGAVLVATAARTLGREVPARLVHALMGDAGPGWTRQGAVARRMVRRTIGKPARRSHVQATLDAWAATTGNARAGYLVAMSAMDLRDCLPGMDVPTTVMVGTRDRLTPPRAAKVLAEHLPDVALLVLPGAGHMLPLEAPDRIIDAIKATARRADQRRPRATSPAPAAADA